MGRRSLATALGTAAKTAELFKGVDACIVSIAPAEFNAIAADRLGFTERELLGNAAFMDEHFSRPLVDTVGAAAVQPQIRQIIKAAVVIIPQNHDFIFTDIPDIKRLHETPGRVKTPPLPGRGGNCD